MGSRFNETGMREGSGRNRAPRMNSVNRTFHRCAVGQCRACEFSMAIASRRSRVVEKEKAIRRGYSELIAIHRQVMKWRTGRRATERGFRDLRRASDGEWSPRRTMMLLARAAESNRELRDREECCGFGGMFGQVPHISASMPKTVTRSKESGAEVVVANDCGVAAIGGGLSRAGGRSTRHLATILASR